MAKQIKIMRGIPGSGKTHYQEKHFKDATVCSADRYFIDSISGEFRFNPEELTQAHMYCWSKFVHAVKQGRECIVVDNCNIALWEISPYFTHGRNYDYEIEIISMRCDVEVALARHIHSNPEHNIRSLAMRIDRVKIPRTGFPPCRWVDN